MTVQPLILLAALIYYFMGLIIYGSIFTEVSVVAVAVAVVVVVQNETLRARSCLYGKFLVTRKICSRLIAWSVNNIHWLSV